MISEERKRKAKDYPILDLAQRLGIEIRNRTCRCINPSHEDKNPSMSFDPRSNFYKCFSCDCKGDTIGLVMEVNKCSFTEAVEFILNKDLTQRSSCSRNLPKQPLKPQIRDLKKECEKYTDIYDYFINILPFPDENSYLAKERCLNLDILKTNNIKNLPKTENKYHYFNKLKKIFPEDQIKLSGLLPIIFNCCAVIPSYINETIVYIQGVTDPNLKKKAKVYNLKGIQFPTLYIPKLTKRTSIHLCEGAITSLFFCSKGLDSIAILSGNKSPEKITSELLLYKNREFVLCPDVDASGVGLKAFNKLRLELFKHGFKYNPQYFNPLDLVRKSNLKTRDLYSIKDFNDLRSYIKN